MLPGVDDDPLEAQRLEVREPNKPRGCRRDAAAGEAEAGELAAREEAGVQPEEAVPGRREAEGQVPDAAAGEAEEPVVEVAQGRPRGVPPVEAERADGRGAAAEEQGVDVGGADAGAMGEVHRRERLPPAPPRPGERRCADHVVDVEAREDVVDGIEAERGKRIRHRRRGREPRLSARRRVRHFPPSHHRAL